MFDTQVADLGRQVDRDKDKTSSLPEQCHKLAPITVEFEQTSRFLCQGRSD